MVGQDFFDVMGGINDFAQRIAFFIPFFSQFGVNFADLDAGGVAVKSFGQGIMDGCTQVDKGFLG